MKKPIKIIHRRLGRHKADGLAYTEDREIHIETTLKGKTLLYTVVHEIMHCQNPKWSEIKVEGHSKEMTNLLWDQGFRKVDLS